MKNILLFLTLGTSLFSRAQHIYGSISGGYLLNAGNDQAPSYIVNTYHQISLPWFWRQENYAFKNSLHTDLNFGHLITEQIGYELSFSYLKPNSVSDNFSYGQKIMSGAFFQSAAKLIFLSPLQAIVPKAMQAILLVGPDFNMPWLSDVAFFYNQNRIVKTDTGYFSFI